MSEPNHSVVILQGHGITMSSTGYTLDVVAAVDAIKSGLTEHDDWDQILDDVSSDFWERFLWDEDTSPVLYSSAYLAVAFLDFLWRRVPHGRPQSSPFRAIFMQHYGLSEDECNGATDELLESPFVSRALDGLEDEINDFLQELDWIVPFEFPLTR